jgi:hypothetical protein
MQGVTQLLTISSLVCLAGFGCVPPGGGAGAAGQSADLAGTYRAEVEGESYELVLAPDGRGTINGTPGSWQLQYGQVLLSDGQDTVLARMQGRDLVIDMPEGTVVFVRQAGAAVGPAAAVGYGPTGMAPPAAAQPFEPTGTLAGEVVAPAGTGAEFTVPDGWTHGPRREADGSEVYALSPEGGGAGIVISRRPLSPAQAAQRPSALLNEALQQLLQGVPVTPVVAAEDLTVAGQPAARTIVRGQQNGQELELYAAGVVAHGYGFLLASMYPTSSADQIRPAFETVLSTFRGSVPPENTELRAQLLGCWKQYSGNTDRSGSTSSSRKLGLQPDGTYWWRSSSHVSAEGAGSVSSGSSDQGRFRVEGNTVLTTSDNGEVGSYTVALQGRALFVNGEKYLPCN